jgi:hypothetical protein
MMRIMTGWTMQQRSLPRVASQAIAIDPVLSFRLRSIWTSYRESVFGESD